MQKIKLGKITYTDSACFKLALEGNRLVQVNRFNLSVYHPFVDGKLYVELNDRDLRKVKKWILEQK